MKKLKLNINYKIAILAFSFYANSVNAQSLTFGTLFKGDGIGGSSNLAGSQVLNIGTGTGTTFVKPSVFPTFLAGDNSGNIAVGYNGGNRISRVDNGATTMTVFLTTIGYNSLKIDNDDEYIYYGGAGTLYRSVWKNAGNTSVGFFSGQPATTSTATIRQIPFLNTGDLVHVDGASSVSAYSFGTIRAMAFDAIGNLYYADGTNHVVRKISMVKRSVTATQPIGVTNTLTLTDVTGIKVGSLVSGINIQTATYVGTINTGTNTITLTTSDLTTVRPTSGTIDNTSTLAFVTGVDHIAGTFGTAGVANFSNSAGQSALSFNANISNYSVGLTFDAVGNLYVADQANSRILKIAATAGVVSASSALSNFVSGTGVGNSIGGFAFGSDNRLYITQRANHNLIRTVGTNGGAIQTIAGSSVRYAFTNYTTTANNTTVIVNDAASISKLRVGMTLRSASFQIGTKVASIVNPTEFTITIPAITSGTVTSANAIVATSEDGYVTAGFGTVNTGELDGANGIVIHDDIIYIAEGTGHYVRVLNSVTTLPVTISKEFTAKLNGSAVSLTWATSSEQNNNRFVVKRSVDGSNYEEINNQPSKGDAGAAYATSDFNPANGDNYYELSQIDNDGKSKVLGVQIVKVALKETAFTVYPNPVNQGASFSIKTLVKGSDAVDVKISDVSGKLIYKQKFEKNATGAYSIQLQTTKGIYVISVNNSEAQKLIVK
ncbi:hypothetical protein D3C87_184580 [compost metagenome]